MQPFLSSTKQKELASKSKKRMPHKSKDLNSKKQSKKAIRKNEPTLQQFLADCLKEQYKIQAPQQDILNNKPENSIKIGNSIFCESVKRYVLKKLFGPEARVKIKIQNQLLIENGVYNSEHWNYIFRLMQQTRVQSIRLWNNDRQSIIQQIRHIKFSNLFILNLNGNMIYSIEKLYSIMAFKLRKLYLRDNLITNIHALRKLVFPCLQVLSLSDNPIRRLNALSVIAMNNIQIECQNGKHWIPDDILWGLKTDANRLKIIRSLCPFQNGQGVQMFRIRNMKVTQALQARYPSQ